ncbi:phage tail fiber protein [Enterobacter hormaechei]
MGVHWHDRNTTVDSSGFIKRASPIVKLFSDGG